MKNLSIYCFVILMACIFSCRRDNIEDDLMIETPAPNEVFETEIRGTVFDRALQPIPQTDVNIGDQTITTDENGNFVFRAVTASDDGSLMTFSHPTYFTNYKFVYPTSDGASNVRVLMNPRMGHLEFEASQGGSPIYYLDFPADAIVDENGDPYNGTVHLYSFLMNTDAPNFDQQIPGDLRAENSNGEGVQLGTFGMISVELETPDGRPLQLGNGKTATLNFKVAGDILGVAPSEIPLWYFDENTGIWTEEGSANLVGDHYIAEVSHFSTWNCDIPFPKCDLKATFVDTNGKPLSNFRFTIQTSTGIFAGATTTNNRGEVFGPVPIDTELTIQLFGSCDAPIYLQNITLTEGNCDLGTITVDPTENLILLEGQIQKCMNVPLTEGYVIVYINNAQNFVIYPDENGNISEYITVCGQNDISIQIFDIENNKASNFIDIPVNLPVTDFDVAILCDEMADEFLTLKVNDVGIYNFNEDFEALIIDGSELLILASEPGPTGTVNNYVTTSIPMLAKGTIAPVFVQSFQTNSVGSNEVCECYDGGIINFKCENNMLAEITEYDGNFIAGKITGAGVDRDFQTSTVEIGFRININTSDPLTRGNISGRTWFDENENGIQDDPATDPINITLGEYVLLTQDVFTLPDVEKEFNTDGTYAFNNAVLGRLAEIVFRTAPDFQATTIGAGNDETIDNDFKTAISGINITFTQYSCPIVSDDPRDLTRIDLGLIPVDEIIVETEVFGCGEFAAVELVVSGGTPPYSYTWSNGATNAPTNGLYRNLAPGTYSILITDTNGSTGQGTFIIPALNNAITVKAFLDNNGNDNFDAGIDEFIQDVSFTLSTPDNGLFPDFSRNGMTNQDGGFIFDVVPYNISDYTLVVETPDNMELVTPFQGGFATDSDFQLNPIDPNSEPQATFLLQSCSTSLELWAGFKEQ